MARLLTGIKAQCWRVYYNGLTMDADFVEIDVRSLLNEGRSPLPLIMNTISSLQDGQQLRLLTSWEPLPLYDVLCKMGFSHSARKESEELWVVEFSRTGGDSGGETYHPPCVI